MRRPERIPPRREMTRLISPAAVGGYIASMMESIFS